MTDRSAAPGAASSAEASAAGGPVGRARNAAHEAADLTRRMVCGGVAGMIAKTATNPLDRIRMLSQTGEHGGGSGGGGRRGGGQHSALALYRSILRNEGVMGLWAGNGANLLRVFPAKAVVFSTNDLYRNATRAGTGRAPSDPLPVHLSFLAGGMAGVTASAATYPLDLARGRITGKLAGPSGRKHYRGIGGTVATTVREEGFRALYKGITPTLLGALPYEGLKFGTVGMLEAALPPPGEEEEGLGPPPGVLRKVLFGGCGGIVAGLMTYPNDTVRRLLQLQGSRGTTAVYGGYWDCVRRVYGAHGIGRFYAGVGVNLIRMAPNTAIQFGSYELLKRLSDRIPAGAGRG